MAWRLAQMPGLQKAPRRPGNAGTAREHELDKTSDHRSGKPAQFPPASKTAPDAWSARGAAAAGVVDRFRRRGQTSARRGSRPVGILQDLPPVLHGPPQHPNARFRDISHAAAAYAYNRQTGRTDRHQGGTAWPAGKARSLVAMSLDEAHAATSDDMPSGNKLGDAGACVDRRISSTAQEPASSSWLTAKTTLPLASPAEDHKRLHGDQGPKHRRHGADFRAPRRYA